MRIIAFVLTAAAVSVAGFGAPAKAARECEYNGLCPPPKPTPVKPKPSSTRGPTVLPTLAPRFDTVSQYQAKFDSLKVQEVFFENEYGLPLTDLKRIYITRLKERSFIPNRTYYLYKSGYIYGYTDVVSSFEKKSIIKGFMTYSVIWKGVVWPFENKQNMQKFIANPNKYDLPFGGFCASCAYQGHVASGQREVFHFTNEKIIFFAGTYFKEGFVRNSDDKEIDKKLERAQTRWLGLRLNDFPSFTVNDLEI